MRGLPHVAEKIKIEMFEARSRDCLQPPLLPTPTTDTEEIVEVFQLIPQERVNQCTVKQTDDQNKQQLQDNQQQLARQAARQERERMG